MRQHRAWLFIVIILCEQLPPLVARRGGILGGSRARGSSASRISSGAGVHQHRPHYGHGTGWGQGGGWGSGNRQQQGMRDGWGGRSHSPKSGGLGKLFGGLMHKKPRSSSRSS
ncbi:hypothetical protein KIN20_003740 [Parelaphostrongylus tenuis]|uniref:Uncharacterized protein n=1 Tax=Parelaphostrongylus tenuis TaxID=148309 RepID=A0AAD5LZM0_PARTN|nr:hypothetical protein KIN20_003740 [Parelaphostrongylus tenuis]